MGRLEILHKCYLLTVLGVFIVIKQHYLGFGYLGLDLSLFFENEVHIIRSIFREYN